MFHQRISRVLVSTLGLLLFTAGPATAGTYPSDDWQFSRAICADGAVDVSQIWSEGSEVWVPGWIDACDSADFYDASWGFVAFTENHSYAGLLVGYRSSSRYNFNILLDVGNPGVVKALCQASSPTRRLSCFKINVHVASGGSYYLTFTTINTDDPILDVPFQSDWVPPDPDCPNCV